MTKGVMNREGNVNAVMRMGEGSRAIAGQTINSLGMSSEDYISQFRTSGETRDETRHEYHERAGKILKNSTEAERENIWAQMVQDRPLIVWIPGAKAAAMKGMEEGNSLKVTREAMEKLDMINAQQVGIRRPHAGGMRLDILLGGEKAAEGYLKRFGAIEGVPEQIKDLMGGDYQELRAAENQAQSQDIFSSDLYQRGYVESAIREREGSGGSIKTQMNLLEKDAYNPDGTVKSPEAALRYRQLSSAYTSSQVSASDMAFNAGSPAITAMAGQGQIGFALGSFGNPGAVAAGLANTTGAVMADNERIDKRLQDGNLTPEARAGYQSQRDANITRFIEAVDRATVSVAAMGQAAAQTGTAQALGNLQRGMAGGAAGAEFAGLADKSVAAIGKEKALIDKQIQERETLVKKMGGDPELDERLNALKQKSDGLETQGFILARQTAIVPLAVGTRRDMSRTDFNLDILGTIPGAVGAMRKELSEGIGNTQRAYKEMEANRATKVAEGNWLEVDQEKFEQGAMDLKRKEAGYRSQLAEGFEGRILSTIMNSTSNVDFISPDMAYRIAVGSGGLKGARFGANKDNQREYLKDALALGTIAGNTSTSDGITTTGNTGARHGESAEAHEARRRAGNGIAGNNQSGVEFALRLPGLSGGGTSSVGGGNPFAGMTLRVVIESTGEDGRTRFQNGSAHFTGQQHTIEYSAAGSAMTRRSTTSK